MRDQQDRVSMFLYEYVIALELEFLGQSYSLRSPIQKKFCRLHSTTL